MFLGSVTVSTFTAFATKFLTSTDVIHSELQARKDRMHAMLQHYKVPWELQKEVMHCFRTLMNTQGERQFAALTEDLPAPVQESLAVYFNIHLLRQVPLFNKIQQDAHLVQLAARMHRRFFSPAEFIFKHGDVGLEVYFVINGIVDIVKDLDEEQEMVVASLHRGQCFGEGALLQANNRRSASAQAKNACELIVLGRDDFLEVMKESEDIKPETLENLLPQRRGTFVAKFRE